MNRRSALASLGGRSQSKNAHFSEHAKKSAQQLFKLNAGLEPYEGPWEFAQAAHLLRRATFGPSVQQIKESVDLGLAGTLELLFADLPMPSPPLNYNYNQDPFTPIGATWVEAPYIRGRNLQGYRRRSLRAWLMGLMINEGTSIREKLTLFWHSHFATSNIIDANFEYRHLSLLRENAWGNFRDLIKKATIDPAMLRFLNGNQNTEKAPNENYARELFELYTVGKGALAGPGDYTTFTEEDVLEAARVLTGWRDRGYLTKAEGVLPSSYYQNNRHDQGQKQLSHRFNNAVINNGRDKEYGQLIDIIFEQRNTALFISRKWYRWFVYYHIDDEIEANVIEPMADLLIANDFEIRPVLETLFSSAHFHQLLSVGPMIKNPIDYLVAPFKQFKVRFSDNYQYYYNAWWKFFVGLELMQMVYLSPPDVAGWKAYYQAPLFYRTWINSSTLPVRMKLVETLMGQGYRFNGFTHKIDVLAFVGTLDNPQNPNELIAEIAQALYPRPLTDKQLTALKEILIPGLEDYVWTNEYIEYTVNPNDVQAKNTVQRRLESLLKIMLILPEYQLS